MQKLGQGEAGGGQVGYRHYEGEHWKNRGLYLGKGKMGKYQRQGREKEE